MNTNLQHFPVLISERLTLRKLSTNDAGEILHLRSNAEVNKFLDRKPSDTLDDASNFINGIIENEGNGFFYWAITKTGDDKLIGTICLFAFNNDVKKCEIGFELLPGYHGQGIMIEAAKKVIAYASNTLGLKRIDGLTHKHNHRSTKLLQNLNFETVKDPIEDKPNLILYRLAI